MAVGEYVSVSSQRDAEQADIRLETHELASEPEAELKELAMIYVKPESSGHGACGQL
jgi:VIT1/CCC1 family predicted Fe2+/Mn2+ transporter